MVEVTIVRHCGFMALLPPFYLDAVVALGFPNDDGVRWAATGFLYFRVAGLAPNDSDQVTGVCYLVTNKHVFGSAEVATVRCNSSGDGPPHDYNLELCRPDGSRMWTGHPDDRVDVAVVPINLGMLQEQGMDVSVILDTEHAMTRSGMAEGGVTEGDGVFVLGFPMGLVGDDRNFVIVRSGALARVRDAIAGSSTEFLIDATVFPGNSGGPVILRPEMASVEGTASRGRADLVGIVGAYLPYLDVAVSEQTGRRRVLFEENTGLSVVHPVDCINDAISAHEASMPPGVATVEEESETVSPSSMNQGDS